jgi:superfamily II DNA/RNA helicase
VLPTIFEGNDVILQSHTGSGKTLAYSLPVLSSVDPTRAAIQAVIVVPTRELGQQVTAVLKQLSQGSPNKIMIMTVVEGSKNRRQQLWAVAEPPHIVVGNPRSLQKLVDAGRLRLNAVNFVVLDEVDACLIKDETRKELHQLLSQKLSNTYLTVDSVLGDTQAGDLQESLVYKNRAKEDRELRAKRDEYRVSRQTILCSATIPQRQHFAEMCVKNGWTEQLPEIVHVSAAALVPPHVTHEYIPVKDDAQRLSALRYVVRKECEQFGPDLKMIVFADHEDLTSSGGGDGGVMRAVESALEKAGVGTDRDGCVSSSGGVGVLLESRTLDDRAGVLSAFRGGGLSVLLCTPGMAARGIDVPETTHVVMLSVPASHDQYVHQAGRTGRGEGRGGKVMVFTQDSQDFVIERFANEIGVAINKRRLNSKRGSGGEREKN